MNEKEKILSKFNMKDYRNDLEVVLENKQFDEEAKSLLLSIFYKMDNFYKDYQSVKKVSQSKNSFLEEYINILNDLCYRIKVLAPQECEKGKKIEIDSKNAEILTFPNETVLLYAIYQTLENDYINKNIGFTNKCLIDLLNKGRTINATEPIRDFNGWSWNVDINNTRNTEYNLIFQNLLILFGYDFISKNINNTNLVTDLRKQATQLPWKEKGMEFIDCLLQIAIGLYNNIDVEHHNECIEYKKNIESEVESLKNRKGYINETTKNNNIKIQAIQRIDIILNDINLIRKEFEKSNEEEKGKYFCISDFVDKLEEERQNLLDEINKNNTNISPKDYLKHQDDCKRDLKLYDCVKEDSNKINLLNKMVKLQLLFLDCIEIQIDKIENKKEYYNITTLLRYYANIPYKKYKTIILQDKIEEKYEIVTKKLISSMIQNKVIDLGFKNEELNYQIIKNVFKTKIIELNNIIIKLNFVNSNEIEIEYYDGDMLDYQQRFEIPFDEEITNKKERKIKLFKIGG